MKSTWTSPTGLMVLAIWFGPICCLANCPIPDGAFEEDLLYKPMYTSSLVETGKDNLSFYLRVEDGIGYLSDYPNKPSPLDTRGVPENWFTSNKLGQAWTSLNPPKAEAIWGKPIDRFASGSRPAFVTYNASGSFNNEKNIYHIDIQFRENGGAIRYRVRGIGICNPQWISAVKPVL